MSKRIGVKKNNSSLKRWLKIVSFLFVGILTIISLRGMYHIFNALNNLNHPIDAYLVLGGSITREIYIAQIATINPHIPIIISKGSDDPCIFFIFQREGATLDNTWLETCADSTFGNFFFSIPILKSWGVKKVEMITSDTHLPRAGIMAKISLMAQGIAVDVNGIPEVDGIPGNHENDLKTTLDITRSFLWAWVGQLINPPCNKVIKLSEVNLNAWQKKGFSCESRGKIIGVGELR
ncbi:YdcF family protein [Cyanobacterium stanieri LEGE 03274]|uniref:YdcF family protein n=1 Tax=Cyanobacterium stanieri LEGE 03274 TaxID=1828756 RepID=A0ABR9V1S8_9CHRO|nr:YdcF family protein [Cyanobacterium stanieri]MBE9221848.1 YdcF family protein [Cyanobacterium stanieri LEGE 03274]